MTFQSVDYDKKSVFNLNRKQAVTTRDAIVVPYITIPKYYEKDPACPDLNMKPSLK